MRKQATYLRKVTLNERFYTIGEQLHPPFVMQFVVKGNGVLNGQRMSKAIAVLTQLVPALQMKSNGRRWENGSTPVLHQHKTAVPDDLNHEIYQRKLNSSEGPCLEFHLFGGEQPALLMRVLHSLMDGTAAVHTLELLFALLRGETIAACTDFPSDEEFKQARSGEHPDNAPDYRLEWQGFSTAMRVYETSSALVATPARVDTLSALAASWYAQYNNCAGRFLIPVNMRRHEQGNHSICNLSAPVFLDVKPADGTEATRTQLLGKINRKEELNVDAMEKYARVLPNFLLRKALKQYTQKAITTGRYPLSGFISDLGTIDLDALSCNSFQASDFFSIPVYTPLVPFCFICCSHKNGTRAVFTVAKGVDAPAIQKSLLQMIEAQASVNVAPVANDRYDRKMVEELKVLWADTLGIPQQTVQDDSSFRDLGGESLSLLLVVDATCKQYGIRNGTAYMNEAGKYSGNLNVMILSELIVKYSASR